MLIRKLSLNTPFARIAAIADLHIRTRDDLSCFAEVFHALGDRADILLVPGDLTEMGLVTEMERVADVLRELKLPILVTLGNHDRRTLRRHALKRVLREAGVDVLEGGGRIIALPDGRRIAIAGVTGSGGGFGGNPQSEGSYGPSFTRRVQIRSQREANRLRRVLRALAIQNPDLTLVMSHFSPTPSTLGNEPLLKYWMLGNALLGETIDEFQPALVLHGHSHLGNTWGQTDRGIPVLNVALPVTGGVVFLDLDEAGKIIHSTVEAIDHTVPIHSDSYAEHR